MALIADSLAIARADAAMLRRQPRLLLALLGVVLIPALYALIYLEAVWDADRRIEALPAIIVNLDRGTEQHGRRIDLGADLVRNLQARRAFGFTVDDDEARARQAVRAGRSLFALIIPPDFSADAMRGNSPGEGRLVVFASEGNHYTGAGLARRFAAELGHQVNETINEGRWALVLGANAGSGDRLARFRSGIGQLREGARAQLEAVDRLAEAGGRLAEGADELAAGVGQLAEGSRRLGMGLRSLDAGRPSPSDLEALKAAAARQETGQQALARGLETLQGSAQVLTDGLAQLRKSALAQPGAGDTLAPHLDPPIAAATRLGEGLATAADAQARLAQGAQALGRGVSALTEGVTLMGSTIAALPAALPAEERLAALTEGGRTLAEGTARLNAGLPTLRNGADQLLSGLVLLERSLPADIESVDGTARGLAAPVQPDIQIDAPVRNDGTALVPPTIPVALWLGAVMIAFVIPLRTLPADVAHASRLARLTGKALLPVTIGFAQAAAVLLMVVLVLRMPVAQPEGMALSVAAASLAFVMITLAVVRALGDAGKALASILLIVQVSASGGIVPVELTSEFFQRINPWLPFTWVVRAVRASLFGAFDREWLAPLGIVLATAVIAFVCAAMVGRWRMVEREAYRPNIDL